VQVVAVTQEGGPEHDPTGRSEPDALAYLGFTSGSTGRPHGCAISHAGLAQVVRWYVAETGLAAGERTVQSVSPGFDVAALEVWSALAAGATLTFLPDLVVDPAALLRWLAQRRIAVAFLPTHVAELVLAQRSWPAGLALRVLSTGGDRLRERPAPDCPFQVLNMYGPTECTIVSTAGSVAPGEAGLPDIGRPIDGARVRVLDPAGHPVGPDQIGELHIGGAVVGRGYHRSPALTATRFGPDPVEAGARLYRTGDLGRLRPDGTIEFVGRLDDQIEIRGHRVEPAEVERALLDHPGVREAAVAPETAASGSVRLTAAVVTDRPELTEAELTGWVADRLPAHMVPARIVRLERLPRTSTGKIDRKGVAR
jgi:amino acid adenylation domain-containing protein